MNLYEIAQDYAALAAVDEDGSVDVVAALDAVSVALEDKCDNIVRVIQTLEAEAMALKAEEDRLAARRKTRESRVKAIRDYVKAAMSAHDIRSVKTKLASISLKDGPPRVVVQDEIMVPVEFTRTVVEIDKAAILDAFKRDGECVPGTTIERSKALTIK